MCRTCLGRSPAFLLADEATSALDVTTAAGVVGLLRQAADAGTAVIMVSHDHRVRDAVSDRQFHLAYGQLKATEAE